LLFFFLWSLSANLSWVFPFQIFSKRVKGPIFSTPEIPLLLSFLFCSLSTKVSKDFSLYGSFPWYFNPWSTFDQNSSNPNNVPKWCARTSSVNSYYLDIDC
jgi:hypothetical protein